MPAPIPSLLSFGTLTPDNGPGVMAGYPTSAATTSTIVSFAAGSKRVLFIAARTDGVTTYVPGSGTRAFTYPALIDLAYTTSLGTTPLMRPLAVHLVPQTMVFWIVIPDADIGGTFLFSRAMAWQLWQGCDTEQPFASINVNTIAGGAFGTAEPKYTAVLQARLDPVGLPVVLFAIGGDSQAGPISSDVTTIGSDIGGAVDLITADGGIVDTGDVHNLGRSRISIATSPLLPEIRLITHYVASAWMATKADGYHASWPFSPGTCGTPLSLVVYPYDMSTPDRGDIGPSHTIGLTLRPDDQAHAQSPWITQGWFTAGEIGAGYIGEQTYPLGSTYALYSGIEINNPTWTIGPGGQLDLFPNTWPVRMNEDSAAFVEIVGSGISFSAFAIARDASGSVWTCGLDSSSVDGEYRQGYVSTYFQPAVHYGTLGQGQNWPAHVSETWLPVPAIADAKMIDVGYEHAAALRNTGAPLLWGSNQYGQLGTGAATTPYYATPTSNALSGSGYPTPAPPIGLGTSPIVKISCGTFHTLVLDAAGSVYSTGANFNGQLGHGDNLARNGFQLIAGLPPIVDIAAGFGASFAQSVDGRLFGTGYYGWPWGWGVDLSAADPTNSQQVLSFVQIHTGAIRQLRAYGITPWIIDTSNYVWRPTHGSTYDPNTDTETFFGQWSQFIPPASANNPTATYSFLNRGFQTKVFITADGRMLQSGTTEFTPPLKGSYAAAGPFVLYLLTGPVIPPPPAISKSHTYISCQVVGPG